MTTTPTPNPMEAVYKDILNTYNPLEIKDILLHGAARKATHHKTEDDVLTFYANHNEAYTTSYLMQKRNTLKIMPLCSTVTINQTRQHKINSITYEM